MSTALNLILKSLCIYRLFETIKIFELANQAFDAEIASSKSEQNRCATFTSSRSEHKLRMFRT